MLDVSVHTYERRPYSATLYPTSFTLDSLLALRICAQHKTYGWCLTTGPRACEGFFLWLYVLGREGRDLAPVGPHVDTATIRTVLAQIAWNREVLARDAVRYGVHTRAQTLFGYFVSD